MEQCWQQDPQKRPSFVLVLEMLKDAMVDIFLTPICPDMARLWRLEKRWRGKEQVKFDSFARAVCKYLRIKYQDKALAFKCLQALLAVEKKKGADSTPMVSIDRLGLVMAWFGPMTALSWEKPKINFLDRILSVLKYGWFFGDIEREESEALLRDFKKIRHIPGTCKLRWKHRTHPNTLHHIKSEQPKNRAHEGLPLQRQVRIFHPSENQKWDQTSVCPRRDRKIDNKIEKKRNFKKKWRCTWTEVQDYF